MKRMLWSIHTALVTKTFIPGTKEDRRFLALSLCGEAGEFANLVKKEWRGDQIEGYNDKLRDELGDIYAYLILNALAWGFDLNEILENVTLPKIKARWPEST